MSAILCGKRSFFEDLPGSPTSSASPPVAKKLRCWSPVRFSQFVQSPSLIDQLRAVFPHMDNELLERTLQECNHDLDSAIKHLHELCLGQVEGESSARGLSKENVNGAEATDGDVAYHQEEPLAQNNLPVNGKDWVELFVGEMMTATSIDDARLRATRVLESLEKAISANAFADAAQNLQKENMELKEQIEAILRENAILKRAVAIQHERQKEYDDRNQEVQHMKELVSQYQEQLRTLEINNYALAMHLRQAQESNTIPGRFHPDVF